MIEKLAELQSLYAKGENIMAKLRQLGGKQDNGANDILVSYDLQAGRYIKSYSRMRQHYSDYGKAVAGVFNQFAPIDSMLEVGVGEATTLVSILKELSRSPSKILGFDISWSRLKFANCFLNEIGVTDVSLFTANLFETPIPDNSIDLVYTSHSIEPNGGKEEQALKELYRITKKYLVLIEPSYEFAGQKARERMKTHGYVTNLYVTAKALNYRILEHRLLGVSANPLNPTGLIVIEKLACDSGEPALVCPVNHSRLESIHDQVLYSRKSLLAYPIVMRIPCLLRENAIIASHLLTNYQEFKEDHSIDLSSP